MINTQVFAIAAKQRVGTEVKKAFGPPGYSLVCAVLGELAPSFPRFWSVWSRYGEDTTHAPGCIVMVRRELGIVVGQNYSGDAVAYVGERDGIVQMLSAQIKDCEFRVPEGCTPAGPRIVCGE